jgi:hypothetical protein
MTNVAHTILSQLGGSRFLAMTGAKHLVASANSLQFVLPRGAKNKSNKVRITLDPSDTYTVEFYRWNARQFALTKVGAFEDVYCDNLGEIFTKETGFHRTL